MSKQEEHEPKIDGRWARDRRCKVCGERIMATGERWVHVSDAERGPVYAEDRQEHEPCEAGTVGCAIDHTRSLSVYTKCETW